MKEGIAKGTFGFSAASMRRMFLQSRESDEVVE